MPKHVTWEQMLERFRAAHGDKYDYSRAEFKGTKHKVEIVGPMGAFWQVAEIHAKGHGDPREHLARQSKRQQYSTEDFIAKAEAVHGSRYIYDDVEYVNSKTKVKIHCILHGEFMQAPNKHLSGQGCRACKYENLADIRRKPGEQFIDEARSVHEGFYTYDRFDYQGSFVRGLVTCPSHGDFLCDPSNHLAGKGCPRCVRTISSVDDAIATLTGGEVDFRMAGKRWDVGLPEHKVVIEHHGLVWHSTRFLELHRARSKHREHRRLAEENGFRYVALYGDEWSNKRELCEAFLLSLIGKNETVYARKCAVVEVSAADAREFYEANHFMGAGLCRGRHAGLALNGELVACMSLGKAQEVRGREGWLSLSRFANKAGARVVGGASRLFKHLNPGDTPVVSYVDLDKFTGEVYASMGFEVDAELDPDYWVTDCRKRIHKSQVRLSELAKRPDFLVGESEFTNTQNMKLYRIFHSGRLRMVWLPNRA